MQAYLEIMSPQGNRRVEIGDKPVTIGRQSDNVLVLPEGLASRHHCVIERAPEGFRLRDLNSSNGTKLNGQPVRIALLVDGDVVSVGRTQIRLAAPAEKEAVETLDESAIVEEEEMAEIPAAPPPLPEIPIGLEKAEGFAFDEDPEQLVRQMAESLPEKSFEEGEIALINARGRMSHSADDEDSPERSDALVLFRLVLLVCFRIRATDIHVEPKNDFYQVRIRVDGNMVDLVRLNRPMGVRLTSLVKVLSDIDISQKNIVQEGHFAAKVQERRVDYRVSFAPAVFGQKLVIRIFDAANAPLMSKDLQLPDWMYRQVRQVMEQDAGMVLVCGPTGSGKTTTLYALVRSLDLSQRNVVTIEDPVEIQIDGVTQIPVNEGQGNTFSALLRSLLRQDPDAMMVGEIRDAETARIAMQAAITGHLVFSTIHTRDTIGSIFRLLDLGVEPYLVASGLHLVLSQRLVRKLCRNCRKSVKLSGEQKLRMGTAAENIDMVYAPGGCPRCMSTGYAGRQAVFELLSTTEKLREVILHNPSMNDIQQALAGGPFVRLLHSGYCLVAAGVTSLDEVERTIGTEPRSL